MFTRAGKSTSLLCNLVCGEGSEREQCRLLHSLTVFSHFSCYPQANWALLVLIPGWVVCVRSRTLWVSPTNSPVRLGVPPAASTPTGVFNQRFEALFPCTGALGCSVCFAPPPFLPVYLCTNVGRQGLPATSLWGLLATAWPAPFHNPPPRWVHQLLPCHKSSPPRLSISAPPTGLDECFFFISLVVGLPYSLILCKFWLFFVFKLLLCFFWLCEEAQCAYLCCHLPDWKSL